VKFNGNEDSRVPFMVFEISGGTKAAKPGAHLTSSVTSPTVSAPTGFRAHASFCNPVRAVLLTPLTASRSPRRIRPPVRGESRGTARAKTAGRRHDL